MRKSSHNRRFQQALLTAALCAGSPAIAQVAGQWKSPQFLFRSTCAYCHDQSLVKGVAPELLGRGLSAEMVVTFLRAGPNAMPSFSEAQISPAEAQALGTWIRDSRADSQGKAR